jgi:hypothetical protein
VDSSRLKAATHLKPVQEILWHRLQGRCRARTDPSLSMGFYKAIMAELDYNLGRRPAHAQLNSPPRDPYNQAQLFVDSMQHDEGMSRPQTVGLQMEDVHLLERFYQQLCLLVEAQKASDPMSLVVVQLVRFIANHCCKGRAKSLQV